MQPIPSVACFGEFVPLLSSSAGEIHVQSELNLEIDLGKTFHFFALINSLTELEGCFGSLSCCNMKHFPMNLVAFSWILVGKMVLKPFQIILLLSSYIKSSVKLRGPVPETAMHAHAMTPPPLSSTTVVFSADQVVVGGWCRWWFPNSWFLHALCFCCSSNWLPLFF